MVDPILLTPGPLTTAADVRGAMARDWGSWDAEFRGLTAELRSRVSAIAGGGVCVPIQGSGTYAVESMLGTFVPPGGRVLALANGAYGQRIVETLHRIGRSHAVMDTGDFLPAVPADVADALAADATITHVAVVHCETTTGIRNPVEAIAGAVRDAGRILLVDAMSSFGALPCGLDTLDCRAIAISPNKCLEGAPGFGMVLARERDLEAAVGSCHSLSLDANDQWTYMERTGQWRYTPPTHVVAAAVEALRIHEQEGGAEARFARFSGRHRVLVDGMRQLGFETLLPDVWQSPIIVSFLSPAHPRFRFEDFYLRLKEKGFVIYPGKLTEVESFRVGCIGAFEEGTMERLVEAVAAVLRDMEVDSPAPGAEALEQRRRADAAASKQDAAS